MSFDLVELLKAALSNSYKFTASLALFSLILLLNPFGLNTWLGCEAFVSTNRTNLGLTLLFCAVYTIVLLIANLRNVSANLLKQWKKVQELRKRNEKNFEELKKLSLDERLVLIQMRVKGGRRLILKQPYPHCEVLVQKGILSESKLADSICYECSYPFGRPQVS